MYEKMIRVLSAFKICFADDGQEGNNQGNQFAVQIGYKNREEQ